MRFKIDENLPVELAELLQRAGHDAMTVNDQRLHGTPDSSLINVCKGEDRAIITLDTDFADIRAYPPEDYPGIMVLRVASQAKPHLMELFSRTIALLEKEPLDRHLWIIDERKVRIRGKDSADE